MRRCIYCLLYTSATNVALGPAKEDLVLTDLWLVVRKRRILLASAAIGLALLVGAYGLFRGEMFTATGEIQIQPDSAAELKQSINSVLSGGSQLDVIIAVSYTHLDVYKRQSLDLPAPEEALIEALAAAGKPLVVVLTNGSALGVNWAKEHANAILEAWYPGEEGGTAVAETLSGANNPAGRLPVTFYKDVAQLPPFADYAMKGRTYRYFEGQPLYPFGYGLSYTTFAYKDLKLPGKPLVAGEDLSASVTVTNTGKVAGDEVVQLYLKFPGVDGAPNKALRGFQRIHLEPGASQELHFDLRPRDLSLVTDAGEPEVPTGEFTVSVGGGQPGTGATTVAGTFKVKETQALPE